MKLLFSYIQEKFRLYNWSLTSSVTPTKNPIKPMLNIQLSKPLFTFLKQLFSANFNSIRTNIHQKLFHFLRRQSYYEMGVNRS